MTPQHDRDELPEHIKKTPRTELEWMEYRLNKAMKFWRYHFERRFGARKTELQPPKPQGETMSSEMTDSEQQEIAEYLDLWMPNKTVASKVFRDGLYHLITSQKAMWEKEARIDERSTFIYDDTNGKNAVFIAKVKNAVLHSHDLSPDSMMCKCGVSALFLVDEKNEIDELKTQLSTEDVKQS